MSIPSIIPPLRTYYDPSLWDRLAPAVVEHMDEMTQHLAAGRWKTLEEARDLVGFIRGMKWVLATAIELTRVENEE